MKPWRDGHPLDGIEDEEFLIVAESDLSERQKMFVHAYMRHRNVMQAAIDAGYKTGKGSIRSAGHSLMKRPKIRNLVNSLLDARMRRMQITPKRIEEELAKVALASLGRIAVVQSDGSMYLDFNRADDADLAGISSFKCEVSNDPNADPDYPRQVTKMSVRMGDKIGALRQLAMIHKMIGSDEGANALVDIADAIRGARKRAGIGED